MSEAAFALQWEKLDNEGSDAALVVERARVFGGWLVRAGTSQGTMSLAFLPDGEGRWDGEDFGEDDYEYEEDEDTEDDEDDEEDEDDGDDD